MELKKYLKTRGRQAALATATGLSSAYVWQIANGLRPIPLSRCVAIEQATSGAVTRQELRPEDWHLFWPELKNRSN